MKALKDRMPEVLEAVGRWFYRWRVLTYPLAGIAIVGICVVFMLLVACSLIWAGMDTLAAEATTISVLIGVGVGVAVALMD